MCPAPYVTRKADALSPVAIERALDVRPVRGVDRLPASGPQLRVEQACVGSHADCRRPRRTHPCGSSAGRPRPPPRAPRMKPVPQPGTRPNRRRGPGPGSRRRGRRPGSPTSVRSTRRSGIASKSSSRVSGKSPSMYSGKRWTRGFLDGPRGLELPPRPVPAVGRDLGEPVIGVDLPHEVPHDIEAEDLARLMARRGSSPGRRPPLRAPSGAPGDSANDPAEDPAAGPVGTNSTSVPETSFATNTRSPSGCARRTIGCSPTSIRCTDLPRPEVDHGDGVAARVVHQRVAALPGDDDREGAGPEALRDPARDLETRPC